MKERSIISTERQKFNECWIGPKLIHNLRQKFITNAKILNENDMISTQMIAEKNPAVTIDSLDMNETRIMYCSVSMQSIEFSNPTQTICIDSTHCNTFYGFYLTTLMVCKILKFNENLG